MNDHRAQYQTSMRALYDALQNMTIRELFEFTSAVEAERSRQSVPTVTPSVLTAVCMNELTRRLSQPTLPDTREPAPPPARLHNPDSIIRNMERKLLDQGGNVA